MITTITETSGARARRRCVHELNANGFAWNTSFEVWSKTDEDGTLRTATIETRISGDEVVGSIIVSTPALSLALEATRLSSGDLPRFSSVGSYPLFYLVGGDESCLCAGCVDDLDPEDEDLSRVTAHVNWETPTHCEECGEEIEAAYPPE